MRAPKNKKKIEPIRHEADIDKIRNCLKNKVRDLLLFDLATQTGIGMTRLLRLRVKDLSDLHIADPIRLSGGSGEYGAGGFWTESLNATWNEYMRELGPDQDDFVFKSRKGRKPLNLSSVSALVQSWFRNAGLEGLTGTRSLQKTWELHFKDDDRLAPEVDANRGPFIHPVKVETVKDKVYREISKAIISGRLAPGERLLEEKIAEQMNVSRMPVREALHRLQESGFVSPYKRAGKIVNQLSRKSLDEITKIRMILETEAVRQAVANITEATLKRLEEIHTSLIEAIGLNEIDEMLSINKQFHFTLYADARMPILQQIILGLWDKVSPYVHILLREGDARATSQDVMRDHKGMLEGMRRRDPDMVCKWLKADLIEGREMVYRLMDRWNIR